MEEDLELRAEMWSNDKAKIFSMLILGVGSFGMGIIPGFLTRRQQQQHPLLITILLCFGAGVLLSTAIVHMLADVKTDLPQYAEIVFCLGFFIVYIADELVHFFCGAGAHNHLHDNPHRRPSSPPPSAHRSGRISIEHQEPERPQSLSTTTANNTQYGSRSDLENQPLLGKLHDSCDDLAEVLPRANHERNEQNFIGVAGLLCALSLHSFLEGLAIGVQDADNKVYLLLLAVSSHKFVVAFCLGVELCANANARLKNHLLAIFIFSMGSVLGIGLGILLDVQKSALIPILQGLAGGTLLYVTVCEVLPREKAKWHKRPDVRSAGLVQLVAVASGFAAMTTLNTFLGDE